MESLRSGRCSPFVISKVLAVCMKKLITACARKNKRAARLLGNARKDHSIPYRSRKNAWTSSKTSKQRRTIGNSSFSQEAKVGLTDEAIIIVSIGQNEGVKRS